MCSYTFSRLLLFAYTGEITVNEQTVCALLPAATMFQVRDAIVAAVIIIVIKSTRWFMMTCASQPAVNDSG